MSNRRPQNSSGRRMDFQRNDRGKNFGRSGVSPWQGGGPGGGLPNLLPLSGGSTEATLALASNIINLLQPRQNPVPSLLDMPIRRDFGPNMGRYDRGYGPNRMGNQGNFRRTGTYNRSGERINNNRKPYRPNDGQRQQNKSSPKKEADSKAKPVKESETDEGTEAEQQEHHDKDKDDDQKKDIPKTRYDEVNPQLLKCHICNKSMWDGRSFENHLSGRAHAIMMTKTAESYALTADTMRQEFKIREMKRTRKAGQQPARDFYCAMCDMYAADGAIHRTTVGHRKLKKYLHPTCTSCHKEMPTRIELDEHRLTAEHLRNMQDKQEIITKPKPEVMVISTLNMEQLYLREDRQRRRRPDYKKEEDKETDDAENKEGEADNQEEVIKEKEIEEAAKPESAVKKLNPIDLETTVLDYNDGDDISHLTQEMFPAYSTERGVGPSFLTEFRCVQCRLCRKLLDSDETAQVHLRTWRHHQLFTRLLAEKSGTQLGHDSSKRPLNAEDSGDAKRRKVDDDQNGHVDVKEETLDAAAEDAILDKEVDGDLAGEELDNWEQTVDEILEDEKVDDEKAEEAKAAEPAPAKAAPAEPAPAKPAPAEPAPAKTAPAETAPAKPAPAETAPAKPAPAETAPAKPAPAEPAKEENSKPEPVKPQEQEKPMTPPAVAALDDKPRASPRGRGRGRARGRGRY